MKLEGLCPQLILKAMQFLNMCVHEKMNVGIQQGFRSFQEQDKLFHQVPKVTNAKGGESWHNFGLGIDVVFRDFRGNFTWANPNSDWEKLGDIGKKFGFEWGGDWKHFQDRPHFQITNGLKIHDALALYKDKGINAVWERVFPPITIKV